jgi:hypothetical protein
MALAGPYHIPASIAKTDEGYPTIATLSTYILAETDLHFLTLLRRDGAGFRRETLSGPDAVLDLPEAGISFSLAELYRDVD